MTSSALRVGVILAATLIVVGCTTTNGTITLTPSAQSTTAKSVTDAQTALAVASVSVGVAEAVGELKGADAATANLVLTEIRTALTAAQTALAAGSTPNLSAQLGDLNTLLTTAKTIAPNDAQLIGDLQEVVMALQLVATAS